MFGRNNNTSSAMSANRAYIHNVLNAHCFALLLLQLLLCGIMLTTPVAVAASTSTAAAAGGVDLDLPAELMLEGVSLLKSFEYAQEQAALKQLKAEEEQAEQRAEAMKALQQQEQFSAAADVEPMPLPPAAAVAAVPRFQRELERLAHYSDGGAAILTEVESEAQHQQQMETATDVERPIELDAEVGADVEYAETYPPQRSSAMWLQLHHNNNDNNKLAATAYAKLPSNAEQQHQRQKLHLPHQAKSHHGHSRPSVTTTKPSTSAAPPLATAAAAADSNAFTNAAADEPRRCAIEITTKLPGVCQPMAPVGNACISGDYIDVYNFDCMLG